MLTASRASYAGDNLFILRQCFPSESIDLVYIDPPFGSRRDYAIPGEGGRRIGFSDTWRWDAGTQTAFEALTSGDTDLGVCLRCLHSLHGGGPFMAYLVFMAPRLAEIRRVLRPTGALYLHCDDSASAELTFLLVAVFGAHNLRNKIVWKRADSHGTTRKGFGRIHDTILCFASSHRHRLREIPEGVGDVWDDIRPLRVRGYPTQKPVELLERILRTSSGPGDLVLDAFGGGGTTAAAAQRLGRRWAVIDVNTDAVEITRRRLEEAAIV